MSRRENTGCILRNLLRRLAFGRAVVIGVVQQGGLAAATLAVIGFVALAVTVWISPRSAWVTAGESAAEASTPVIA